LIGVKVNAHRKALSRNENQLYIMVMNLENDATLSKHGRIGAKRFFKTIFDKLS